MSQPANDQTASVGPLLDALKTARAAELDAVGWHYIETLAQRMACQTPAVQRLLRDRLERAVQDFQARLTAKTACGHAVIHTAAPSPMARLLQEIAPAAPPVSNASAFMDSGESPRLRQFRQQLRKISVQKQVAHALAQAPHNAGPINSHMLVLRAMALMRDISPDYLNRFMTHVDTLLRLDDAERQRLATRKSAAPAKAKGKR